MKQILVQTSVLTDVKITDCFITRPDTCYHLMNFERDFYRFDVEGSHFSSHRSTNFAPVASKVSRLMSRCLQAVIRFQLNGFTLQIAIELAAESR